LICRRCAIAAFFTIACLQVLGALLRQLATSPFINDWWGTRNGPQYSTQRQHVATRLPPWRQELVHAVVAAVRDTAPAARLPSKG